MSQAQDSQRSLLRAAFRRDLFRGGLAVLAAVSGGADSSAMLHALSDVAEELKLRLTVGHVNHMLRGDESDADEDFVREVAKQLGLEFVVRRVNVRQVAEETKGNLEETARLARHAALSEMANDANAEAVALAHTADDRAETLLLNLMRGTGIQGLSAMQCKSGRLIRPLIDTSRQEVELYMSANRLSYRTDSTNADISLARNRVRHELIPYMRTHFNVRVTEALIHLADIAEAQADYISRKTDDARVRCTMWDGLDVDRVTALPEALRFGLVRAQIERAKGNSRDIEHRHIAAIVDSLYGDMDATIDLPPGNLAATRRGNVFAVRKTDEVAADVRFNCELVVPGETHIPEAKSVIFAEQWEPGQNMVVRRNQALVDMDKVVGKLTARNTKPGDRIVPFGIQGSKKLQDVFVDAKINRNKRRCSVVIEDCEKVVWVAGVMCSELVRILPESSRVIKLTALEC